MDPTELIHSIDEKRSLEFLAAMVRHKSYSQTDDEAQDDIALELHARVDQCLDRAEIGGIACLHI